MGVSSSGKPPLSTCPRTISGAPLYNEARCFCVCVWGGGCLFISGLLKWLSGKSTCQCRRHKRSRFDSWSERSPGVGNGNPLQYSCLENPTDRYGGAGSQESDMTECAHTTYLLPVCGSLSEKTELKSQSKHCCRPLKIFLLVLYSYLI